MILILQDPLNFGALAGRYTMVISYRHYLVSLQRLLASLLITRGVLKAAVSIFGLLQTRLSTEALDHNIAAMIAPTETACSSHLLPKFNLASFDLVSLVSSLRRSRYHAKDIAYMGFHAEPLKGPFRPLSIS